MTDHPTAPVQDDDAELRSEARRLASDVLGVFHYAEDAVREAVGNTNYTVIFDEATRVAAILERSRPSPTPETDRQEQGVPASPSGCQPSASAAVASSLSGIPNAGDE